MKRNYLAFLLPLVFAGMINLSGCGKEKCGCEAETRFTVTEEVGYLYMESEEYAYINAAYVSGRFTLCNPEAIPESLRELAISRFDPEDPQPVTVYFSGEAKDDCIKLYYQWYYYYYDLVLTDIENAE